MSLSNLVWGLKWKWRFKIAEWKIESETFRDVQQVHEKYFNLKLNSINEDQQLSELIGTINEDELLKN
ncbi:hypothetical protein J4474_01385 [Candidatus Pacearchaeota archaeon]|nr:hypothetical protein [Candidatus Pacearchaeota archaeon]